MEPPRPSLLQPYLDAARKSKPEGEEWAPMLDIKLLTGRHFAIRNGNLLWIDFYPSERMVVRFSTHTIRLSGIGLDPLYRELEELHCKHIVEVDEHYLVGDESGPIVTRVEIERKPGGPVEEGAGDA